MIKNLSCQLNEAGKIKIGIKGKFTTSTKGNEFRPPQKLNHFILTTTEKNDSGDYVLDTVLMNRIKENGTGLVNDDGNLIGIPIRLLYDKTEMNFPTRYACYVGRKLSCYGDGEKAFRRIDDYKKEYPCPCNRLNPDYDGDHRCKANGRLICMIDEAGLFGQVHVFRTTSINSIKGIWGGMGLIKIATKGRLAGVPLMLTLTARHTDKGTVYVVSVCFNGTMEALRDSVHALALKEQVYLLDMPNTEAVVEPGTEDEQDFVEEFYPDAVTTAMSRKDQSKTKEIAENEHDKQNDYANDGGQGEAQAEEIQTKPETNPKEIVSQGAQTQTDSPVDETDQSKRVKSTVNIEFRLLKDSCSYNTLYNRFIVALSQDKFDDALKLAQRLDKDRLEKFFTRERPDIIFPDPKPKKTDYLDKLAVMVESPGPILLDRDPSNHDQEKEAPEEHPFLIELKAMTDRDQIAKAMVEFFKPMPVNLTLDRDGLIAWAESKIGVGSKSKNQDPVNQDPVKEISATDVLPDNPTDPGKTTEEKNKTADTKPNTDPKLSPYPELYPYDSSSGPIIEDQLRTIVRLKNKLEKEGLQKKEEWPGVIAWFATDGGEPMTTATAFSFNQGFKLIEHLNAKLPEEDRENNIVVEGNIVIDDVLDDDIPF